MEHLSAYFRSLSDPTRLRIVNLLLERELCGCELQHVLRVSQSNVSRHLTYLKNNGLVVSRRKGPRVSYVAAPLRAAFILDSLRRWFRREPALVQDRERLRAALRAGLCRATQGLPQRKR